MVIQGLIQACKSFFKLELSYFLVRPLETLKSGQMTILKDLHVYLLLYQSLYDHTNPIGRNSISVLVLIDFYIYIYI